MKLEQYDTRQRLGFPKNPWEWEALPANFSRRRLEIAGHAVMESWEKKYMRVLGSLVGSKPRRVLEIGFGLGLSARVIQEYEPEEHIIIEANRDVYKKLQAFASKARHKVTPILGFWQDVTKDMPSGSVSSILFDTYPLDEEEIHRNHFPFFPEAYRLLEKGGLFTYYSDEPRDFSREHLAALREAGFRDIRGEVCPVKPPADCMYWQSDTILAPIVFK